MTKKFRAKKAVVGSMEVISLDESSSDEDLPNFSQSFKRSEVTVDSREMNPVNTAVYDSTCHHDQVGYHTRICRRPSWAISVSVVGLHTLSPLYPIVCSRAVF